MRKDQRKAKGEAKWEMRKKVSQKVHLWYNTIGGILLSKSILLIIISNISILYSSTTYLHYGDLRWKNNIHQTCSNKPNVGKNHLCLSFFFKLFKH